MTSQPASSSNFGAEGGALDQTLTTRNLPSHSHSQMVVASTANGVAGDKSATGIAGNIIWSTTMASVSAGVQTSSVGSGAKFSILPPYIKACVHVRAG